MREYFIDGIPYISKEQFCKLAHIRKANALKLIQSGLIPYIDIGNQTHRYLIRQSDAEAYLTDRAHDPAKYSFQRKSRIQTYPGKFDRNFANELSQYASVLWKDEPQMLTVGFIKLHERSGTLTLTGSGRAFLELIFNGAIPSLSLSYHGAAIERRIRLSRLMLSAYQAGIDVFASEVNVAREIPSLFLTSITRTRGRNSWGSSRVAAIVSLGGIYYAAHYVCPGIGRMAVNDELAAFHNHTNFGKNTQRAFLFAGSSYESVIEELKNQDEKRNERLIRYGEAYHCLHAPIHLLSCDETGAQQLQIMTVPDYRVKLTRLMLRSAYQPPPEDIAAWDGLYNGHPFVIGADMDLRRIDTAVRTAEQHGCLPIALAALEGQGSAVLLQRYADPGCATVYKVTENVLSELLGRAPNLYVPPRTQFLTEKGDVVDAPLIKTPGKAGGPHRK